MSTDPKDLENLSWNYRVIRDKDATYYKVVRVYYNNEGIWSWVDCTDTILVCPSLEDLKGTVEYVQMAFDRPVLVLDDNEKLTEKGIENK